VRAGTRNLGLIGVLGFGIVLIFCLAAVIGPVAVGSSVDRIAAPPFLRPGGAGFLLGTDELGRSELARVIVAARIAIVAAFGSVLCGLVLGVAMGVIAAYVGGVADQVLGRLMDFIFGFPSYVLPILIAVVLGPGLWVACFSIGLTFSPQFGRISRTATLNVRHRAYVSVAKLSGRSPQWIIFRHILPNIVGPLAVMVGLSLANAEGSYAVLAYLGYGVAPPAPDYGSMLSDAQVFMLNDSWAVLFPCIALVLLVLGFVFIGDWLRERFDPRGEIRFGRGVSGQ
jgi:ABC-type dipeptide/oligopeptide/nickel transport system permease subunit